MPNLTLLLLLLLQVTVIPVVAKADTMTEDELATYREEVRGRSCGGWVGVCVGGVQAAAGFVGLPGVWPLLKAATLADCDLGMAANVFMILIFA